MCAARRALTGIALAGVVTAGSTAVTPRAVAAENGLIAYTTGNGDETRYRVRTVRPDGTRGRVLLKANARFDGGPAGARWSPDGRKLVFAQYHRSHHAGKALWYATAAGKRVIDPARTRARRARPATRRVRLGAGWPTTGLLNRRHALHHRDRRHTS